jgi:cupin 2 domain-containing protein
MTDNIFNAVPANSAAEIFTNLIKKDTIHIERIVSYGHTTAPGEWYQQQTHEWVMLIKGAARLEFEHGRIEHLTVGDYINIPAHQKHRVNWTQENTETIWLAVHY